MQTDKFLNGQLDVELDSVRGWRNRRSFQIDKIRYDRYGSCSNAGIVEGSRKELRVILLGDSKVNGYTYVENSETINAYLEDDRTEVLNMGTSFYGLDQSYLTMIEVTEKFEPDVIVIGIGSQEGQLLGCHNIPFMVRKEQWMPLLKPQFALKDGQLVL